MIEKATKQFEVEVPELPQGTKDISLIRDYNTKMEERIQKQEELRQLGDLYYAAKDIEVRQLEAEREILNFKIKSFTSEILPVVKFYKYKHFINFLFPLIAFIISVAALTFYLFRHY